MVSEVTGPSSGPIKGVQQRRAAGDKDAASLSPTEVAANRNADIVSLTDLAARLQQLTQSIADIPAVDRRRIEEFTQAIARGAYELDTAAIAEKLATFERLIESLSKPT